MDRLRDYPAGETLSERVARLEERHRAERELSRLNFQILQGQIDSLQRDFRSPPITTPHGLVTWGKLALAFLLPFLIYANLITPERAAHVSRALGGP